MSIFELFPTEFLLIQFVGKWIVNLGRLPNFWKQQMNDPIRLAIPRANTALWGYLNFHRLRFRRASLFIFQDAFPRRNFPNFKDGVHYRDFSRQKRKQPNKLKLNRNARHPTKTKNKTAKKYKQNRSKQTDANKQTNKQTNKQKSECSWSRFSGQLAHAMTND